MGSTTSSRNKVSHFIEDIKTSWYFRVWLLLWVVCAAVSIACLALMSKRKEGQDSKSFQVGNYETVNSMPFPTFHLRFGEAPGTWKGQSINCNINGEPVAIQLCYNQTSFANCFAVDGPSVVANNSAANPLSRFLDCTATADIAYSGVELSDNLVAWEIDGPPSGQEEYYGGNSYAGIWIQPATLAWVMLTPVEFNGHLEWERVLLYHGFFNNSNQFSAVYQVSTLINSFTYWKYRDHNFFDGWMDTATTGGFVFFTLILHTIVLFFVGFLLNSQSSKFLYPPSPHGTSSHSPEFM